MHMVIAEKLEKPQLGIPTEVNLLESGLVDTVVAAH